MSETRLTRTLNSVVAELNRHADLILRDEFDLTYNQFVFLVTLSEKDSLGAGELAKLLSISQPASTNNSRDFLSLVPTDTRMVLRIKVSTRTARDTAEVDRYGPTVLCTKDTGNTINRV